ncbi:DUF1266 domain-containing protein [Sutterella seckii]|nr:DUF1266 domain-containing protein [Sutterella seckii]
MTDKNTEAFVREQAQAVLKVQEEAINSQMKMMESLYGDNPEMLAMMKAQLEQAMANQSALISEAQTAAFEAVDAAQSGGSFDPQSLIQAMQKSVQAMGVDPNAGMSESREEGYDNAKNYIDQLQTDFTESEPRTVARGSREARIFGYLLGGIVGNLNGHELDQLDPEEHEPFFEEKVRTILSDFWGITTTEELGETLSDLLENGGMSRLYAQYANAETFEAVAEDLDPEDAAGAMERWHFARHFRDKVSPEEMRGWDIGRASALVRWGHFVGLIDEATAEAVLEACAEEASARFTGWRAFGISYLFGGLFWRMAAGEELAADWLDDAAGSAVELLTDEGEWLRYPWVQSFTD